MAEKDLNALFLDTLKDIYYAEKQIYKSLPKMAKAANSDQFKSTISNLGIEPSYLDAADFAKFWAADAKHADEAVQLIGRVG